MVRHLVHGKQIKAGKVIRTASFNFLLTGLFDDQIIFGLEKVNRNLSDLEFVFNTIARRMVIEKY